MKRAEMRRRQREKGKDKAQLHLTREQVKEIAATAVERHALKVAEQLTEKNFIVMFGLSCWALHDTFGFGKERLGRFVDNALTKYDCMIEDYDKQRKGGYDFDVAMKVLKTETGFDMVDVMRKRGLIK